MKKFAMFAIAALTLASCSTGTKNIKNLSEKDSVAYCLGIDFGKGIKQSVYQLDSTLNYDIIMQGLKEGWNGEEQINIEDAYAFLNDYFYVRVPARNLEESTAFLEKIAKENPNVKVTDSGLMYEIIETGNEVKPSNAMDQLLVSYKGTLKDGQVFDQNDSIELPLGRGMIQGWEEGLKFIGEGGKINLYIPSTLGYGAQARGQIKANDALVFEVELHQVITPEMQGKGSQR